MCVSRLVRISPGSESTRPCPICPVQSNSQMQRPVKLVQSKLTNLIQSVQSNLIHKSSSICPITTIQPISNPRSIFALKILDFSSQDIALLCCICVQRTLMLCDICSSFAEWEFKSKSKKRCLLQNLRLTISCFLLWTCLSCYLATSRERNKSMQEGSVEMHKRVCVALHWIASL